MSAERREVLELLRDEGGMTPKQIAVEIGKSRVSVRAMLKRMAADGLLVKQHSKYIPSLSVSYSVTERESE